MILRRYGTALQSVELNFDSKAMTEIGFRRDQELSISHEQFQQSYSRSQSHELTANTEGYVQDEVERTALKELESRIRELESQLAKDAVLGVESEQGVDYPKTRTEHKTVLEGGVRGFPEALLGLYRGVDLTQRSVFDQPQDLDMIFLYRRPILDYWCETGEDLTRVVRHVLIHEIGHHFGFSDEDMEAIEAEEY